MTHLKRTLFGVASQLAIVALLPVGLYLGVRETRRHAATVSAQPVSQVKTNPDCQFYFQLSAVGAAPGSGYNNIKTGCNVWSIVYFNYGFSALSFTFQTAANSSGSPGSWGTGFPVQQNIITGSNPATNTTGGYLWVAGQNAFTRVQLTSATGTGNVTGSAFGWRIPSAQ